MTRVLVVSWCSFDEVIATVGDERAVEVVDRWLRDAGIDHDVAWAGYLGRFRALAEVDPAAYTHLVFVCGPLLDVPPLAAMLARFGHAHRVAVGVSVVDRDVAGRFHTVLPRDGAGVPRPDLAAAGAAVAAPVEPAATPEEPAATPVASAATPAGGAGTVVATVHAPRQPEYGPHGAHDAVRGEITGWLARRRLPWFDVETDVLTGDRTTRHASQVTGALARADVVVSSRLHGLVLGLAAGRPVVAVDPVVGGAKVTAQAAALGWPVVVAAEELDAAALDAALERALAAVGTWSAVRVAAGLDRTRRQLLAALGISSSPAAGRRERDRAVPTG